MHTCASVARAQTIAKAPKNYRMLRCHQSHVLEKSLFCCGKVHLPVRTRLARTPPAAGRKAAFPFLILHAFSLFRLSKKKSQKKPLNSCTGKVLLYFFAHFSRDTACKERETLSQRALPRAVQFQLWALQRPLPDLVSRAS